MPSGEGLPSEAIRRTRLANRTLPTSSGTSRRSHLGGPRRGNPDVPCRRSGQAVDPCRRAVVHSDRRLSIYAHHQAHHSLAPQRRERGTGTEPVPGMRPVAQRSSWVERMGDTAVLVAERYDRTVTSDGTIERLHQEDMCQAVGLRPKDKYLIGRPSDRMVRVLREFAESPQREIMAIFRQVASRARRRRGRPR